MVAGSLCAGSRVPGSARAADSRDPRGFAIRLALPSSLPSIAPDNVLPANAEDRLTINPHGHTTMGTYPPTVTGSWIALGAWAVVSLIVALVVVRRRDV